MKRMLTLSLAGILCGGLLFAQQELPRRGFRGETDPAGIPLDQIKTYLSLTDQQLQGIRSAQSALREAAKPIMEQLAEKFKALREAMQQDPVNSTLLSQLRTEIENLQKQEQSLRAQYRIQAQSLLTAEQKSKLAVLQQALELLPTAQQGAMLNLLDAPKGFGPGFGGPGGRGGRGPGGGTTGESYRHNPSI